MRALAPLVGIFAFSCAFAQSGKTTAARTTEPVIMARPVVPPAPLVSEEMVNNWIRVWQKRLALEEWRIEAKIVRIWELPQNAVANIHWSIPNKKATIKVLNSVDSTLRKSEIVDDTELSVVHELIHLSMAKLPLDPNHTEQEEETVKRISVALVSLQKTEKLVEKASK
jgi:hypothetical protein